MKHPTLIFVSIFAAAIVLVLYATSRNAPTGESTTETGTPTITTEETTPPTDVDDVAADPPASGSEVRPL